MFHLEYDHPDRQIIERHLASLGLLDEVRSYSIDVEDAGRRLAQAIKERVRFPIREVETRIDHYNFTQFGVRFLAACRPPTLEEQVVGPPEE